MIPRVSQIILVLLLSFLAGAVSGESFQIKDIRVEGLQRISAGTVFNYLPVKVGDTLSQDVTPQIIRALYKTGFFKDVRLEREGDILVVFVTERPAVAKIDLSGNKDLETENLLQALKDIGLAEGRVFNRSILDRIEQELRRQYFSHGKYGVKIESTVTPLERNRVGISIDISEGVAARIKQINIIGNKTFDDEELLEEFELGATGWFSFYTKNDSYSKQKLSGDLEKLRSFYLDRGYINFEIESTQVSITPDKKDIYVTIVIREGDIFTISDIKLAGNLVVPKEDVFPLIRLSRNEVFSRKEITNSSERINQLLGDRGYAFANVNSIPDIDQENKTVAITFFMDPGKRVFVRRITMLGNTRTRDEVLRREMRQMEAGWFSTEKIRRSRERLQRLGYFEEVNIETPAVPGTADQVDVKVTVKEKPSGNLMAGLGYSQSQGVIFSTSVTQDNFLGTGKRVSLAFNNSSSNTHYQLAYTNPYYTIDGVSRGFNLSYREVDFDDVDSADYATNTGIAGVLYGVPITDIDRINFGFDYMYTEFMAGNSLAAQEFEMENGSEFHDFMLSASWKRDSRNRAVFPTRGGMQSVRAEITVPGSDLTYYKLSYVHQRYFPLIGDFTMLLKGDVGYGAAYGDTTELPFFKNYFAGGPKSVRGFEENTLGPRETTGEEDPLGGNLRVVGNAELIMPSPFEAFEKTVRVKAFFDIGNVFNTETDDFDEDGFDAGELRYSVGLAATWLSPVGVLSVSFAQPLNDESGDDVENFQFSFGQAF